MRTFRLVTGIITELSMDAHTSAAFRQAGARPAPNVGIYARVVRNEENSKTGYKWYSMAINGCLGLQIIVAASLTAMGAAGTSHVAITAFGAINTIIAAFLTYLKGSGLPNRLKYYQNEWKKLREYIEQRERDLSREGCTLDLYEVMSAIERMYEETKIEIETNTPEGYTSVGNLKRRNDLPQAAPSNIVPLDFAKGGETFKARLEDLEKGHYKGINGASGFKRRVHDLESRLSKGIEDFSEKVDHSVKVAVEDLKHGQEAVVTHAQEAQHQAIDDTRRDVQEHARERVQSLADTLASPVEKEH